MRILFVIAFLVSSTLAFVPARGQEEEAIVKNGNKYLDFNIKRISRYNKRTELQHDRLLKKLQRKEKRYGHHLEKRDSVGFVKFQQQSLSYDSIRRLNKPDSSNLYKLSSKRKNATIDTLKSINKFIQGKANIVGEGKSGLSSDTYAAKLADQNAKLGYRQHISDLIKQRTTALKGIDKTSKVKGFKSIDKNAFYSAEKVKAFKQMSDEPSKIEDKAFEYLQGQEGFDNILQNADGMQLLAGKGTSITDMEKLGYQSKQQLSNLMQNKLGGSTSGIQQSMSKQLQGWNDKVKGAKGVRDKAEQIRVAKQSILTAKQKTNTISKPSFKVNPMRGKPFSQRIEKQLNWQTTRASVNGTPAIFQAAALAGFKHTPNLTYGAGIATSVGLGQDWKNIKFTFEGIGLRTYVSWEWQYGIAAYTGYERMFKKALFTDQEQTSQPQQDFNGHNTTSFNEAVLIGLTKKYRINEKVNGNVQLLYDIWWKEKGLKSPIQLRFATLKN